MAACLGLVVSQAQAQTPAAIETPTAAVLISNVAAVEATVTPEPGLPTSGANQRPTPEQVATVWVVTPASLTATPTPNGTSDPSTPSATAPGVTVAPTTVATGTTTTPNPNATPGGDAPMAQQPFSITIRSSSGPTRTVNLGEQIVFTVELKTHDVLTEGVFISATIPDGTDYVSNSAVPAQADSASSSSNPNDNSDAVNAARRILSWAVQPMGSGQTFLAQYTVVVSQTTSSIVASARSLNLESGRASASNAVVLPTQPTAITLIDFNTQRISQGVKIIWQTGQELNTFSFVVLRSNDGNRSTALPVTQNAIPAQGSGTNYEFVDNTAQPNQTYTYWLQEVERDFKLHDYGPISSEPATVNPAPQISVVGAANGGGVPLPVPVVGAVPRPAQTAQVLPPIPVGTPGQNNSTAGQINQVQAQPVATTAPEVQQNALPPPAEPVVPTNAPQQASAPTQAAPPSAAIATIAPPTSAPQNTAQPNPASVDNADGAGTATPAVAANGAAEQPATTIAMTPTSAPAAAPNGNLPAAPAAQEAKPPVANAAAAPQANEESRNDRRWGPLNWFVAGLFACFGWLIVSSFLAVAVGRYLKGRQ